MSGLQGMRSVSASTPRARHGHIQAVLRSSQPSRTAAVRVSAFLEKDRKTSSTDTEQAASRQLASADTLQSTSVVASLMAQPATCLSALAGFALIASNIPVSSTLDPLQAVPESASSQSAPQQLLATSGGAAQAATVQAADSAQDALQPVLSNPVLQLDETIHQYVATHTTEAFRLMADVWISDGFIVAGVLGWLACTTVCLVKAPVKSAGALAAAWGFYFATCGGVGHGDPLLVDALKQLFARARPSTLHHTFSFPSGHTSAAVFTVGALLTVLLPLTLQLWAESARSPNSSADGDSGSNSSSSEPVGSSAAAGMLALDVTILGVWAAAWGTTATGRILSESHWLSDTMAGGMLAVASVSGLAFIVKLLMLQAGSKGDAASGNASAQSDS